MKVKKTRLEAHGGSSTPVPVEYWEDDGQPEPSPEISESETTPVDTDSEEEIQDDLEIIEDEEEE